MPIAPNGHAVTHANTPRHFSLSIDTIPVFGSFDIALLEHAFIHAGLSQWLQLITKFSTVSNADVWLTTS